MDDAVWYDDYVDEVEDDLQIEEYDLVRCEKAAEAR